MDGQRIAAMAGIGELGISSAGGNCGGKGEGRIIELTRVLTTARVTAGWAGREGATA